MRRTHSTSIALLAAALLAACGSATDSTATTSITTTTTPVTPVAGPAAAIAHPTEVASVGQPFGCDASLANTLFTDPKKGGLTYQVSFSPSANGLVAQGGVITGAPATPGVITARVVATDVKGDTASQSFAIVAFANGLPLPVLPTVDFAYSDASAPLPAHYRGGPLAGADNTPGDNAITNPGAALGHVLFHDVRLSVDDRISCGSCHVQSLGFGDSARFSAGSNGGVTTRHTMGIVNARFYQRGRFFWDERASSLEAQVLQPIQNPVEMGMTLEQLRLKVSATSYYPPLFQAAFGTSEVTTDRIARALAQYVRSIVSTGSRFDSSFAGGNTVNLALLTEQEQEGFQLFNGPAGCAACHGTNANVSDDVHNTGLDATVTDVGAGGGRFKAPSLRNVAVRAPFMHDGRFKTLAQVVEFYDSQVQPNPNLDPRLRGAGGLPKRLGLTASHRASLVAYLNTLTDPVLLKAAKFASPFPVR
ncbi:MAG: hypothetical protein JWO05_3450 [Gemmatimonadetes bacterium]|nr:hypothetical protein [Gemmatimonadota bacterium]